MKLSSLTRRSQTPLFAVTPAQGSGKIFHCYRYCLASLKIIRLAQRLPISSGTFPKERRADLIRLTALRQSRHKVQ